MAFKCSLCPNQFKLRHQLQRHIDYVHIGQGKHACSKCWRSYSRPDNLLRHQRTKHGFNVESFVKRDQDVLFTGPNGSKQKSGDEQPCKRPRNASPIRLSEEENSRENLDERLVPMMIDSHALRPENDTYPNDEPDTGSGSVCVRQSLIDRQMIHWKEDPVKYPVNANLPDGFCNVEHNCGVQDVIKLYTKHWQDTRTRFQTKGRLRNNYNFRLNALTLHELVDAAKQIFEEQSTAVKINVGFGFFLRNIETCQLQYYYASNNTRLFSEPALVTDQDSFQRFTDTLSLQDPLEHVRLARPNSKWVVELVTNAMFYVYKLRDHPIGGITVLPDFVAKNKAVVGLDKDRQKGMRYNDNLCLFRCLALHKGEEVKALEKKAKTLYEHMYTTSPSTFKGVKLSELSDIEARFKINIIVYELFEARETRVASDDINHDVQEIIESTELPTQTVARLIRRSLEKYEDTMYLNKYGDHFSYIVNIDGYTKSFQCQKCLKLWQHRGKLHRHEATCDGVGVKHTFPGGVYTHPKSVFELLEEESITIPAELRYHPHRAVFDFESYFENVQDEATNKLTWEAKHIPLSVSVSSNVPTYNKPICFISEGSSEEMLRNMLCYLTAISQHSSNLLNQCYAPYIREIEIRIKADQQEFEELCETREKNARPRQHYLQVLLEKLNAYLNELPVIGFNSGSYDINLTKSTFFPWLVENDPLKFIVKRNNNYMAVKSKNLLFLDITNFIAPGFSYEAFLKAYNCSQQKGFFPYEWITLNKLNDTELPPHDAFYSDLKKANISNNEYAYCQRIWQEEGMENMKDFLKWYNNLDVVPFLEALEKMADFYRERKIDVFKDGISVPGLTMKYLFQMANGEPFAIFSENDKDLYYTFRNNLVGGPSIIFNRHQEKNVTKIRDTDNFCQKIVGFDANALYLWAIMQDMPTGSFLRRREETGFKIENSRPVSIEWLEWKAHKEGVHIRHKWNDKEKQVGIRRIPVDGFCHETNTVYQFHGCYWHAHTCHLTENNCQTEEKRKIAEIRREKTTEIRNYIQTLGYNYEEIWECDYHQLRKSSTELTTFIQSLRFPLERSYRLNPENIVRAIRDDNMFGAIECDIHVPEELKPKFAEMCPIFKNTEISVDDIGEHMQAFALEGNIMPKPRKSLIGSMFGEKILLATPLVKWYLEKGLKITRIYQVIEFTPKTCFETFGKAVTAARREGDSDPSKAIIGDTMKLMGNSSYGKTITNKEGHRNVKIVPENKASRLINETAFRDLNEISTTCFEVESAKRSIVMDLPLQIGLFVYQYAKLRMLQFYYDFLDKYFDRKCWEYVEMDTDSAYIAIAAEQLDELVKLELREMYEKEKHQWLPRTDTQDHIRYDKRTPGLFKVEWEGDGIVALNSKMYYCFGKDGKDKYSCKGVNKKRNDIRKHVYLDVLKTKTPQIAVNKGFRVKDNQVFTYSQVKSGFTYFYPKRKVLTNGIQTTYLDI